MQREGVSLLVHVGQRVRQPAGHAPRLPTPLPRKRRREKPGPKCRAPGCGRTAMPGVVDVLHGLCETCWAIMADRWFWRGGCVSAFKYREEALSQSRERWSFLLATGSLPRGLRARDGLGLRIFTRNVPPPPTCTRETRGEAGGRRAPEANQPAAGDEATPAPAGLLSGR